uniref:Uncharacterized protein n=1 Tax=Setaria viridis TaxID=4556 RepID=A0A4U6TK54_SETVI|nr:hypothetical protein SEVIR_7G033100v2 [Setaria viridis]
MGRWRKGRPAMAGEGAAGGNDGGRDFSGWWRAGVSLLVDGVAAWSSRRHRGRRPRGEARREGGVVAGGWRGAQEAATGWVGRSGAVLARRSGEPSGAGRRARRGRARSVARGVARRVRHGGASARQALGRAAPEGKEGERRKGGRGRRREEGRRRKRRKEKKKGKERKKEEKKGKKWRKFWDLTGRRDGLDGHAAKITGSGKRGLTSRGRNDRSDGREKI